MDGWIRLGTVETGDGDGWRWDAIRNKNRNFHCNKIRNKQREKFNKMNNCCYRSLSVSQTHLDLESGHGGNENTRL